MTRDEEMKLLFEDSQIFGFWVTDKNFKRVTPEEYLRKMYKKK